MSAATTTKLDHPTTWSGEKATGSNGAFDGSTASKKGANGDNDSHGEADTQ
jgi:hypothetical protein